jgi:hypothetical protein
VGESPRETLAATQIEASVALKCTMAAVDLRIEASHHLSTPPQDVMQAAVVVGATMDKVANGMWDHLLDAVRI